MTSLHLSRPTQVKDKIQQEFDEHVKQRACPCDQGIESYHICSLSELSIIKHIINSNLERKDFYVMDVGAGNFIFNKKLTSKINQEVAKGNIPGDITIHIFGLTGTISKEKDYQIGICKLYNYGHFMIENLHESFMHRGISNIEFDLVLSSYTLNLLTDPVSTMLQIYDVLSTKPNTGYFLFHGFQFELDGQKIVDRSTYLSNMNKLLYSIDEPYLVCDNDDSETDSYILKRNNEKVYIPFKYVDNYLKPHIAKSIFCLEDKKLFNMKFHEFSNEPCEIRGNETLFNHLYENDMFHHGIEGKKDFRNFCDDKQAVDRYMGPIEKEDQGLQNLCDNDYCTLYGLYNYIKEDYLGL
jgi:hypothetical protein